MSVFKDKNKEVRQEFSKDDYDSLREGMKSYSLKRINGRLHGAFEQFCADKNIISFSEFGDVQIINPPEYTRLNHMRSKIEAYDDAKLKEAIDSSPEEREAWIAKIEATGKAIREAGQKLRVSMNV